MDTNHTRFLDAVARRMLLRVKFRSATENKIVEHTCAPVHFGAEPGSPDADPHYWIWDYAERSDANPVALTAEELVRVQLLNLPFDPTEFSRGPAVFETAGSALASMR